MGGNQVSGLYTLHMRPLFPSTSNKVPYVPWSAAEKSLRWEVAHTRTWSSTGFSERSRSRSDSLISFLFFGNYFSITLETKLYDDLFTFLQLFILSFCLAKTSSYKAKPSFCNKSFSLLWLATMQIAWNKRTFLHDKSPIPKRFFGYANLTAILFCIWPPWSHVKTIDKVTLSGKHFLKLPKWTDWILPFPVLHLDEDQWNTV